MPTPIDVFRPAQAADLAAVVELETASYPADEAASPDKLRLRLEEAGDYFFVATDAGGDLVGFVCGTRAGELSEEAMAGHDPAGDTVCVHSVVVAPAFRRQGAARAMVRRYVRRVARAHADVARFALIAKAPLLQLYISAGFAVSRLSPIVHGADPWFELLADAAAARGARRAFVGDAFTQEAFRGNPAAVVFLDDDDDANEEEVGLDWMRGVATETNAPMTAFVWPHDGGIRWVMPSGSEVPLCGHATLVAAHLMLPAEAGATVAFRGRLAGVRIAAERRADGGVALTLPASTIEPLADDLGGVLAALAIAPEAVAFAGLSSDNKLVLEVAADAFAALGTPDFGALAAAAAGRDMVVVTSRAPEAAAEHCRSRAFAPMHGLNEDPVCGSAHCGLGPYWAAKLGVDVVVAQQPSARGGGMRIAVHDAGVTLEGHAVATLRVEVVV